MARNRDVDVSVVLPVFNNANTIKEALESVLDQKGPSFEIVVVDDGSTDDTTAILKGYESRGAVRLVKHEENHGLPAALNTGIDAASGTYIMRQDGDDRSLPGRLASQWRYMKDKPEVDLVGTAASVIDTAGGVQYELHPEPDPETILDDRNPLVHGSIMFDREAVKAVGGYDEFFRYCQDYDLYQRLVQAGYKIDAIDEIYYELRRGETVNSVAKRKELALYFAIARLPTDERETAKEAATESGLEAVYDLLPEAERARYNRRLVRAHVEHRHRTTAISHALSAAKLDPFSVQTQRHLALALAPFSLGQRVLDNVQGR